MTASAQIDQAPRAPGKGLSAEAEQLQWLLGSVGVTALDTRGWIRVTGEDRTRWLNGMVTNSIQALQPGEGNYSFALSVQGRVQGDLWAFADADEIRLETARDRVPAMMALFDRFIIMDDVELRDISTGRAGIGIVGPRAADLLGAMGLKAPEPVRAHSQAWNGPVVEVIAFGGALVPRFELWTDETTAGALRARLASEAEALGGGEAGSEAVEWLRMLEGTPIYGIDIRDKELPQETGQTRALHFAKGCYLGQEIVERIRSRGNVHRGFGAFVLTGPLPEAGAALEADGKVVGELTSVAGIPVAGGAMQVALGYVRREAVERGATLIYGTGSGTAGAGSGTAVPAAVPLRMRATTSGASGITTD